MSLLTGEMGEFRRDPLACSSGSRANRATSPTCGLASTEARY